MQAIRQTCALGLVIVALLQRRPGFHSERRTQKNPANGGVERMVKMVAGVGFEPTTFRL